VEISELEEENEPYKNKAEIETRYRSTIPEQLS
jgi:hypothetical protein